MNRTNKDFDFSKRAAEYDAGFEGRLSKPFYRAIYRAMLAQVELNPNDRVLDIGCGTGFLLKRFSEQCPITGAGIDVEANMVQIAKEQCPGMDIRLAPADNTPFDDASFDVITACMAYHHFSNKEGFAAEVWRLLKPGGRLYIADPLFPFIPRKGINTILRLHKIAGEFLTPEELSARFQAIGFAPAALFHKGHVQVVAMERAC